MAQSTKSIGVLDTDTLLYSFRLECPPKRVIERIDSQFDIFLPDKVCTEFETSRRLNRLKEYEDIIADIQIYLGRKRTQGKVISEREYASCLEYSRKFFCLIGKQAEYTNKFGDGEKHCIALALYLSRTRKTNALVLTDDFKAIRIGLDHFVKKTYLGSIRPLLEAMIFAFTHNSDISPTKMKVLVSEYFKLNPAKTPEMQAFRTQIEDDIVKNCRLQENWGCGRSCRA